MRIMSLGRIYLDYLLKKPEPSKLPHRIWVEPTNDCNLRCTICPNSKEDPRVKKGFMDFELYKKIVDEASEFSYDINLFHRGESLLHPKIYDMIAYASQKGLNTRLHTNATLLTEENAERIFDSGLHYISFSFDGYDKETYEGIRKGASFDNTYRNVVEFVKKKGGRSAKKPFTVLQVIESWNEPRDKIIKKRWIFMEGFKGLPLDKVSIRTPHNWGGSYGEGCLDDRITSLCTFPWYSVAICWDGEVLPCPQDFYGNLSVGNVSESSIKKIWKGEKLVALRSALIKKSVECLDPCKCCDMLRRKTFLGVPINYLTTFLGENL